MPINIVEAIADLEECAFDQPCKFGHRVESHAVYCHNDAWDDSPRKCRRNWYTGGELKDEDCPGFQPNPEFRGVFAPTPIVGPACTKCGGTKLFKADCEKMETCPRCQGDGADPRAMAMSQYEQDTLDMGIMLTGKAPAQYRSYVRIAEDRKESDAVERLAKLGLVTVRSMSFAKGCTIYLLKLTAKGDAVRHANWNELGRSSA